MATFSIPSTTVQPGVTPFGPFSIADADLGVVISVNRNQAPNPLNGLTAATTYTLELQQSVDGGTTWHALGGASGIPGGSIPTKTGGTLAADSVTTTFNNGTGRLVRAQVTVTGSSPVTLSGSITTT